MRASQLRGGRARTVEFTFDPKELGAIPSLESEVEIRCPSSEWLLRVDGRDWVGIKPMSGRERDLEDLRASGLPRICWLAAARKQPDRLTVQVVEFLRELAPDSSFDFGVDEAIVADLRKHLRVDGSVDTVTKWLTEHIFLGDGDRRRAIVIPATRGDQLAAFTLLGDGVAVEIRQKNQRYVCHRIVRRMPSGVEGQILRATMRFCDATAAAAVRDAIRTTLEHAVRSNESYLGVWSTYRQIESETLHRKALNFGTVAYRRWERVREADLEGWRFFLDKEEDLADRIQEALDDDSTELEANEKEPNLDSTDPSDVPTGRLGHRPFVGRIRSHHEATTSIVVTTSRDDDGQATDISPPERGFLFISQEGDRKRLQRQQDAEERIRLCRCPMPWLALLFEGLPPPRPSHRPIEGMSPTVRAAFGGTPTPAQQEALTVALNTPDIALIQGPPGTGKTKVISALQRRIAELAADNAEVAHRILITSAQHEAVENVVLRSKVYGLSPFKVGKARNDRDEGIDPVEIFRQDLVEAMQARNGPLPEADRADRARRAVISALRATCSRGALAAHIEELLDAVHDLLTPTTVDQLRAQVAVLRIGQGSSTSADHEEQQLRMEAAQGIRTVEASFQDDGPLRARVALRRLDAMLTPEERRLLSACADCLTGTPSPAELAAIETVRDSLVDRLTPRPPAELQGIDAETEQLLVKAIDELQQRRISARGTAAAVVADWMHDLDYDPDGARDVLRHYTAVLAATLQHAGSRMMNEVRGVLSGHATFDSVIVDEAARCHPLDLLIPMSLAKRRIVLVGDHRQLPHMLEPDIERQLAERARVGDALHKQTEQRMRQSLFEHLWVQLKKLEAQDGIRRTATLDVQFRMHPVLGDFVSRTFYESKGDRRIESPLPAEDFAHQLPGYRCGSGEAIAAWIDVPIEDGQELRGRSKSRPVEAHCIAKAVHEALEADPSLSIGVIAFYRRQVDEIYEAMQRLGLTQSQDGNWQIVPEYRQTRDRHNQPVERLRIGTVDAFQGREFDVVFLSQTRSNRLPSSGSVEDLRRKYGHLMLENRMCVAMSRQHRLLVCVGDLAFAEAAEPIPHLQAFVRLCRGPHGVIR